MYTLYSYKCTYIHTYISEDILRHTVIPFIGNVGCVKTYKNICFMTNFIAHIPFKAYTIFLKA